MGTVLSVRVGVNLLWCLPGAVGGSEEYLVRQLAGLHAVAPEVDATLYVVPGFAAAHRDVAAAHELVVASLDARRRSRRVLTESTWLPRRLAGSDVVHHAGGTVPARSPGPVLLTVHDLQYRTYPEYVRASKRRYLQLAVPMAVRRAAVVAVPSEYVRGTVIEAFGAADDRVVVVPHGVDPPTAGTTGGGTPDDGDVRGRYGLEGRRFVVHPAITHPHKGHRFLLELLAGPWDDADLSLVLLGGRGLAEDDVAATIERLGLGGRVVRPGRVPDHDRDALIAAADALVFPSEYEGFGAPLLEAMVLGTPIVCSDRAAVPEVVGDAALVRPLQLDAWADALDEVARGRDALVAAGHRRAARFSTAASGAALSAAYSACVDVGAT